MQFRLKDRSSQPKTAELSFLWKLHRQVHSLRPARVSMQPEAQLVNDVPELAIFFQVYLNVKHSSVKRDSLNLYLKQDGYRTFSEERSPCLETRLIGPFGDDHRSSGAARKEFSD